MASAEITVKVQVVKLSPVIWLLGMACAYGLLSADTAYRWALNCIWLKVGNGRWERPKG